MDKSEIRQKKQPLHFKTLIVAGKVRELCEHEGKRLNVGKDVPGKIEEKVKEIIKDACLRAIQNQRTTVMGKDI